jgi:Homeodomain-like domain
MTTRQLGAALNEADEATAAAAAAAVAAADTEGPGIVVGVDVASGEAVGVPPLSDGALDTDLAASDDALGITTNNPRPPDAGGAVATAVALGEPPAEADAEADVNANADAEETSIGAVGGGSLHGSATRPRGRPPNINENSLVRRLECLLAVDRGQISMKEACERYAISARTFYRWLSDKERLVELTGYFPGLGDQMPPAAMGSPNAAPAGQPASAVDLDTSDGTRKRIADVAFPSVADFAEKRRLPATRPRTTIRTPGSQPMRPHLPGFSPPNRMPVQMSGQELRMAGRNGSPITPQKTRVTLEYGDARAVLGWHFGANASEIRDAIARRFSIDDSMNWAFIDGDGDELVVSHAIPSGTYKIVVLGKRTGDTSDFAGRDAVSPAVTVEPSPDTNCKVELTEKLANVDDVVTLDPSMPDKRETDLTLDQPPPTAASAEI